MEAIQAIIGLGNPGAAYRYNRHNIGFLIVDAVADRYGASWQKKDHMLVAKIPEKNMVLVKPQTFMNASGKVVPWLKKQGIQPEHMVVVHDELEKPFGSITMRFGGSARGHNGLRSIIDACGKDFHRLRFGIGRPEHRDDVGTWVLSDFSESKDRLEALIDEAVALLLSDK